MTNNKQKIFQLVTSINLGGAENVAFHLSEQCMVDGDKSTEFTVVELYRSRTDYASAKRIELKGKKIKTHSLFKGSKRLSLFFAPFALFWAVKKERPAIIHSHTDLPDLVLATTIRLMRFFRMRIPEIVRTIHNAELWPTHPRIGLYTESAFQNDSIVGVSRAALEAYIKIRKENKLSISSQNKVIYNGCNLPIPSGVEFELVSNTINMAFCGRFEYQKGVDILVKRIKAINRLYADRFHFYFIGDGQLKEEVSELTKECNNVFVHKAISSIGNKLHHFDFILMPSRFEGLGLVSIEASFSKVPVIASNVSGLNETLPRDWPLWFDLNNEKELLDLFGKIINQEFDLEKLKETAFGFVNQNFTMHNMIQEYNKIYTGRLLKFNH